MSSFQEAYRNAKLKATEKPVVKKEKKIAKPKPSVPDVKAKVKGIIKARKEKREEDPGYQVNYAPRASNSAREKRLPNKPLNLDQKIRVQIDSKTWVYVDPEADIEAVKAKYLKRPLIKDKLDDLPAKYQF